ncbi:GTP cyclohydrolase I FolE [bacterium]|nr:GTP cyclohydrolase I FolE [bacterium]
MEKLYLGILNHIGEDPDREGLVRTPERAARAMEFLTRGYHQTLESVVNNAIFETETRDMIILKDIEIYSLCEHHLLPFYGKCHIGYIPNKKMIGVSKLARIADMYARRLQVQERLTHQIASALCEILNPCGVGVVLEARHLCAMMRGVEKQNSIMQTSAMLGSFENRQSTRIEFLNLIANHS